MVRHIRDPVTGRCVVCDMNHGPNTVVNTGGPSSWDNVKKKVIYQNAFNPQRSPSPTRSRAPSPSRRPPTNDIVYVNGHPPAPVHHYHHHDPHYQKPRSPRDYDNDSGVSAGNQSVRSASKVHLVGAGGGYYGGGRDRYPDDRYYDDRGRDRDRNRQVRERTPSPSGDGCCGRSARRHGDRNYDHYKDGKVHGYPGRGRGIGAAAQRSSVYNGQASNWGRRRCCALLVGLLLLALLAGLAAGLWYGITKAQSDAEANAPETVYPGGYYVDGVYVMAVTESPEQTYLVFGLDTPCNPNNNNTGDSNNNTMPNCKDVTTRIVASNYTTPTPATVMVVATESGAAHLAPGPVVTSLALLVASLFLSALRQYICFP